MFPESRDAQLISRSISHLLSRSEGVDTDATAAGRSRHQRLMRYSKLRSLQSKLDPTSLSLSLYPAVSFIVVVVSHTHCLLDEKKTFVIYSFLHSFIQLSFLDLRCVSLGPQSGYSVVLLPVLGVLRRDAADQGIRWKRGKIILIASRKKTLSTTFGRGNEWFIS